MKRKASPFDIVILVVLIVIGIVLGRRQTIARNDGKADAMTSAVQSLVSPISRSFGNATASSSDFFSGMFAGRRLAEENRRLRALAIAAEMYTEQLGRLQGEIDRLRKIQGFAPLPGKTRVLADVVGYSPYESRITLNVGAQQGIPVGAPVEAAEGLVGTVQVVERDRCQVLLLTHRNFRIVATDMSRKPAPAGFLTGHDGSTLTLTFQDPQAPVEVGDHITTYGASQRIPGGIFIGKVISVDRDEEFGALHALIDPSVNVGNLREVHVLK